MKSQELIGLNTKWYRYQMNLTQEEFAEKVDIKLSYLSRIECGRINLTCSSIDSLAKNLKVQVMDLFNEETALQAKKLPSRVDKYTSLIS